MTHSTQSRMTPHGRLERSREDRILAGVAGGIGTQLGVNPWWIRFAFIILSFVGGLGLLLYAAAWLVIPDAGEEDPLASRWLARLDTSDGGAIFGAVLIGLAAVIVVTKLTSIPGTLILAAVLFVAGFLLYRGDIVGRGPRLRPEARDADTAAGTDEDTDEDTEKGEPSGAVDGGPDDDDHIDAAVATAIVSDETGSQPPAVPAASKVRTPRPPRERSVLGTITLAAVLIVVASMAMLDLAFGGIDIDPVGYVAAGVAVVGAGLLVGAWIGRARWLILVALLALPVLWFTALWPSGLDFTADEIRYEPATVSAVDSTYELGFGSLTVDLSALSSADLAAVGEISARVGAGDLVVIVPAHTGVEISAELAVGSLQTPFGNQFDESNGFGIDKTFSLGDPPAVLRLDLEMGAGRIRVAQVITADLEGSNT